MGYSSLGVFIVYGASIFGADRFSQGDEGEQRGLLASSVPAIAKMQESLGLMQQDISEIKDTTNRIEQKTDRVIEGLDTIASSFSEISQLGGLIQNPDTPEEYYHNARLYELKGDYGGARRSYLEYFKSDLQYLDPHLRFTEFLKVQEGRSGARESYQYIANRTDGVVAQLALSQLWDRDKRISMLEGIVRDTPDLAPAYYMLSLDYSLDRLGDQSLSDKDSEKKLLDVFRRLDEEGQLVKYFIDKEVVAQWRDDADVRMKKLTASLSRLENPVTVTWNHANSGWTGDVMIAEPALEIFWRKKGEGDFKSTGKLRWTDPDTGKLSANQQIQLARSASDALLVEIEYVNADGGRMGPYEFEFNPDVQSYDQSIFILSSSEMSWLSFRDFNDRLLLYFTHLLSHRAAFKAIKYGLDKEKPDTLFEFPTTTQAWPAPIGPDLPIHTEIPKATEFVTVQIDFKDGTSSNIVRFHR